MITKRKKKGENNEIDSETQEPRDNQDTTAQDELPSSTTDGKNDEAETVNQTNPEIGNMEVSDNSKEASTVETQHAATDATVVTQEASDDLNEIRKIADIAMLCDSGEQSNKLCMCLKKYL